MLQIKNINLSKKQQSILSSISLELAPGTINTLIGKSGAGKTSLLKCIGQLEQAYSGSIEFENRDLKNCTPQDRATLIGFVFQQYNLFPHMTLLENCSNPLRVVKNYSSDKANVIASDILESFDLKQKLSSYPINLSGGQQQRGAIARALCFNPKIVCLDEPSSALDPENTALLVATLKSLAQSGTTIVLSSQDMFLAKTISDKIVMLDKGRIVEEHLRSKELSFDSKIKSFMNFSD